jgi:hypothetical protein
MDLLYNPVEVVDKLAESLPGRRDEIEALVDFFGDVRAAITCTTDITILAIYVCFSFSFGPRPVPL